MSVNRWLESPLPAVWLLQKRFVAQHGCVESPSPSVRQGNHWLKQHEDHCSWSNSGLHHTLRHVSPLRIWHFAVVVQPALVRANMLQLKHLNGFGTNNSTLIRRNPTLIRKVRTVKRQEKSTGGGHLPIISHRHSMNPNNTLIPQFFSDLQFRQCSDPWIGWPFGMSSTTYGQKLSLVGQQTPQFSKGLLPPQEMSHPSISWCFSRFQQSPWSGNPSV